MVQVEIIHIISIVVALGGVIAFLFKLLYGNYKSQLESLARQLEEKDKQIVEKDNLLNESQDRIITIHQEILKIYKEGNIP